MISPLLYALVSVALISLMALIGIFALSLKAGQLRILLNLFVSFAAGALFGDVFLHLLPEIGELEGFSMAVSVMVLSGIVVFFLLEKVLQWHHHHTPHSEDTVHTFAVMNLVGDAVHNLIDGLIIGASYLVDVSVGLATTIAVFFHEIPQEIGDYAILIEGGFTPKKALMFNFLTALTSIFGVIIAFFLQAFVADLASYLIPFAAGGFIYIAGSDLIPVLHKEVKLKKSAFQFMMFLSGLAVMGLLRVFG